MTGWIQTYTGRRVNPLSPRDGDIHILDIAHALSNLCRFTGHTRYFYSVAQHSCHVHDMVPTWCQKAALLHDAAEAYLSDVSSPVKTAAYMRQYAEVERRLMERLLWHFECNTPLPEAVHEADLRMLYTEKRDLLPPCHDGDAGWGPEGYEPYLFRVPRWEPDVAKLQFLQRARVLLPAHFFAEG